MNLRHRADAHDAGRDAEESEQDRQPLPILAEALLDVVERTAQNTPVRRELAVLDREEAFGILRRHAEERRKLHPEERTRAARPDRRRDTDDVARANRCRKRGTQRAKGRDVTCRPLLGVEHIPEGVLQVEDMVQAQNAGEQQACHENRRDERHSPHVTINLVHPAGKRIQPAGRRLDRLGNRTRKRGFSIVGNGLERRIDHHIRHFCTFLASYRIFKYYAENQLRF